MKKRVAPSAALEEEVAPSSCGAARTCTIGALTQPAAAAILDYAKSLRLLA